MGGDGERLFRRRGRELNSSLAAVKTREDGAENSGHRYRDCIKRTVPDTMADV